MGKSSQLSEEGEAFGSGETMKEGTALTETTWGRGRDDADSSLLLFCYDRVRLLCSIATQHSPAPHCEQCRQCRVKINGSDGAMERWSCRRSRTRGEPSHF